MTQVSLYSEHPRWGLSIKSYPKLYTKYATPTLSQTTLILAEDADWRSTAISTISDICKLDQNPSRDHVNAVGSLITLEMLKSVLELTRFPREFENFALPSLVAGSMALMSSVQPTPFSYEYGYLCFRILVFSLNACLIQHGRNLSFTIKRMGDAPPGTHLSVFWDGAADLIAGELSDLVREKRLTDILSPGPQGLVLLDRQKLDKLLKLLHRDQKNFLVALMTANSLQLSGVMFVLLKYLESEQAARSPADFTQKLFLPFSRIFRRYRLVFSETNHETELMTLIYARLPMSDLQDKKIIDWEDSRNVIHAYNYRLQTSPSLSSKDAIHYMGFVSPLFTVGCEDMLPSLVESSFGILWKNLPKTDWDQLVTIVQGYGVCFWYLFDDRLEPLRSTNPEPWRYDLVDAVVRSDILELAFRVAVLLSQSRCYNLKHRLTEFFHTMISLWEKTVEYTPKEYFAQRIIKTGTIESWQRYFTDFSDRLDDITSSDIQYIEPFFSRIFSRAMRAVLGSNWRATQFEFLVTEVPLSYEYVNHVLQVHEGDVLQL